MCDGKFLAILPKALTHGDEIILRGKIRDDAKEFSFNFALDSCPTPTRVAYHFKTLLETNEVVHNYKNCYWMDEIREENIWIPGGGEEFVSTFFFNMDEIIVYNGDEGRDLKYRFEHRLPFEHIQSVQVWGDVEFVREITFRYGNSNPYF